ncbi:unnamed protein product, partial [Cladocopium goreaui]
TEISPPSSCRCAVVRRGNICYAWKTWAQATPMRSLYWVNCRTFSSRLCSMEWDNSTPCPSSSSRSKRWDPSATSRRRFGLMLLLALILDSAPERSRLL